MEVQNGGDMAHREKGGVPNSGCKERRKSIRVLLADDHPSALKGMCNYLRLKGSFRVVAGTSENNMSAVGIFGVIWHYNGVDWYQFNEINYSDLDYHFVWTEGNEVFVMEYTRNYPHKL